SMVIRTLFPYTTLFRSIRTDPRTGQKVRTDLSATLFFSEPDEYDGGELVVEDTYGAHSVKLPAGDMILYPSSSLHQVLPITRGRSEEHTSELQSRFDIV